MIHIGENIDIKSFTTFGVPAVCSYFTEIFSIEELNEALDFSKENQLPLLFLGGGSNMLFVGKFEGLAVKLNLQGIKIIREEEDHVFITAKAGENWHNFVLFCIENNWGGIENLSLIPGNAGTSPIQNIGAYGVEIKDVLHSVEAFNIETREIENFDNSMCDFGYRESFFKKEGKGKYVILSVCFKLTRHIHKLKIAYGAIQEELNNKKITCPSLQDVSNAVIRIRKSKLPDPLIIGNAGSFFKNPEITIEDFKKLKEKYPEIHHYILPDNKVKIPAGWLIEKTGWKGKRQGETGVHEKQALVLVNYGAASGKDIFALSEAVIKDIKMNFNIELEREVNIIK